jgi:hypothetical protein
MAAIAEFNRPVDDPIRSRQVVEIGYDTMFKTPLSYK